MILAPVFFFPVLILCALFLFRESSLKRSAADPAIYAAQTSPAVAAQIGLPMQPGWSIRGNVQSTHGYGNADLQIPLSGSRGKAMLVEWAQQELGVWHICSLELESANGGPILLVDSAKTRCEAE